MKHYDIIIAGAGLSGLTLALELAHRPAFQQQKILLLDRDRKERNDRTWCFWAKSDEPLPPVIHKTWDAVQFLSPTLEKTLALAPYRYHMVRGIDFYRWAKAALARCPNVEFLQADLQKIARGGPDASPAIFTSDRQVFTANWLFNSAFLPTSSLLPPKGGPYAGPPFSVQADKKAGGKGGIFLLQHFKGWLIRTPVPTFDPAVATFMDFRIPQQGETRFMYLLPLSDTQALVEFTVFSPALLPAGAYEQALRGYLDQFLTIQNFSIEEEEFGVIPMADFPFQPSSEGRVIDIGTAGGFVKASSGYAFLRTQRKVRAFVADWVRTGRPNPKVLQSPWHFRVFDSIFLRVLAKNGALGSPVFSSLFATLPTPLVLRFLDEDSSFWDNLRLVSAPPKAPFLQAAVDYFKASGLGMFR